MLTFPAWPFSFHRAAKACRRGADDDPGQCLDAIDRPQGLREGLEGLREETREEEEEEGARGSDRRRAAAIRSPSAWKNVSNDDWENPHDPDAKITRMQNGTTRMASKVTLAADLGMRASIPKRASQKQQGWPSQAS
ncbi:MAG: hypothetical protein ACKOCW_13495 [Planctomycetaceae bacterium]